MSKVLRTVGKVVGVAALITGNPILAAVATVATTVGELTAKRRPDATGQVNDRIIGANNPQPYLIGRTYSGGVQVHDAGWGGKVDKVQNPYRFMASVYSCCGPVESLESVEIDFATVTFSSGAATGYYADHLWIDTQLGTRPESASLSPQWAGTPDWGASYKLSGFAAIGFSMLFDKEGEVFAGGALPVIGAIWEGVKVYDPRLDSTYPGGSGSHRITDESTWAYSRNPALHALAYSYGRTMNGTPVFGVRLFDANAIDISDVVAWANICDTNSWYVDGTIYEPGDKWNNLRRICEAGGAQPVLRGGVLGFDFQAPRTSLATVTKDDLAQDGVTSSLGKGWKNRVNTLVPKYRSEDHQWSYQQADAVAVSAWVTADGEEKSAERQWDLVTGLDQVTELAIYDLYQRREAGSFAITCKPHMRGYVPGDCLTLHADLGAHPDGAVKCVIRSRNVGPATGLVQFTLEQETDGKHTAALGATGAVQAALTMATSQALEEAWFINDKEDLIDGSNRAIEGLESDGTVSDDKVVTASVLDEAITTEGSAFTSGTFTIDTSWQTVQTLSITTTGEPVLLFFGVSWEFVTDNAKGELRIQRDGSTILSLDQITVNSGEHPTTSIPFLDAPAAGSHTYTLQALSNDDDDIGVANRSLIALEIKK